MFWDFCLNKCDLLSWPQVVYSVGLCICLFDVIKLDDSYIFPGDGASHTKGETPVVTELRSEDTLFNKIKSIDLLFWIMRIWFGSNSWSPSHPPSIFLPVQFRYVVFHPFLDEILVGKIKYCSQEGVHGNFGVFLNKPPSMYKCFWFPVSWFLCSSVSQWRWASSMTSSSHLSPSSSRPSCILPSSVVMSSEVHFYLLTFVLTFN